MILSRIDRSGASLHDATVKHARETFVVSEQLKLAVVADTHSRPHHELGERLRAITPDRILHAGDVGDRDVVRALERHAPVTVVRGNVDGLLWPDAITIDVRDERSTLFKILLVHIGVSGPKLRADTLRLARAEDASLVVCGHSHVPLAALDRGVTVFNPGSVGPRRFQLPIVLGVIDVKKDGVALAHIDCETGAPWRPAPVLK